MDKTANAELRAKSDKKPKKIKSPIKRLIPLIASLAAVTVLFVTLLILRRTEHIAEWLTMNISRWYVFALANATSLVPFSVFEWLLILFILWAVAFVIIGIVFLIRKRFFSFFKGALIAALVVMSVFFLYYLSAGPSYYRSPLPLDALYTDYNAEYRASGTVGGMSVDELTKHYLDDYTSLGESFDRDENGNVVSPYSFGELNDKIAEEFKKLDKNYFFEFTPRVNKITNSWYMSGTGFSGIAFLPTGEPNINYMVPSSDIPHTMAHEIAHTKGVMRESDANLVAYYVLLSSSDPYLRYCGYFSCFGSLETLIAITENLEWEKALEFSEKLPDEIRVEQQNASRFWWSYDAPLTTFMRKVGDFFNDLYLKLNGAANGAGSYSNPAGVIDSGEKIPGTEEIDPETGEIIPGTGETLYYPVFSRIHKLFFSLAPAQTV